MRVVIALGGNALQRRGEPMTVANERAAIRMAAQAIARVANANDVVVTHGNGPQVGLLALQTGSYDPELAYPFDVLGSATQGMIGYLIANELGRELAPHREICVVLTQVQVDPHDEAFTRPTKFVGPVYHQQEAAELADRNGWQIAADGDHWRRVVPSPRPIGIVESATIRSLVGQGAVVICGGGGGIPVMTADGGAGYEGIEAVIDKDRATAVISEQLSADLMIIATDAAGVFLDWGQPTERLIERAHPDQIDVDSFPAGSMGPKVESAVAFARSGGTAVIGSLADLDAMVAGNAGTRISCEYDDLVVSPTASDIPQ